MGKSPSDPQAEPPFFKWIEAAVDAALQKHGKWTPEVSDDVGEIFRMATAVRALPKDHYQKIRPLAEVVKEALYLAIVICLGNRSDAARELEITVEDLDRQLKKYTVKPDGDA